MIKIDLLWSVESETNLFPMDQIAAMEDRNTRVPRRGGVNEIQITTHSHDTRVGYMPGSIGLRIRRAAIDAHPASKQYPYSEMKKMRYRFDPSVINDEPEMIAKKQDK